MYFDWFLRSLLLAFALLNINLLLLSIVLFHNAIELVVLTYGFIDSEAQQELATLSSNLEAARTRAISLQQVFILTSWHALFHG